MRHIILAIAILICTAADAQIIRAEPFYTAPEAVSGNLLLDDYPGAAVAYSLRKLDKDYTGSAIRVRRSSDNTEQDIGFVNNYLDTASMKTFVGANNGFVVTWYNQADSSGVFGVRNATNATAANQPIIISSGTIVRNNGIAGPEFASSDFLASTNFTVADTVSVLFACEHRRPVSGSGTNAFFFDGKSANNRLMLIASQVSPGTSFELGYSSSSGVFSGPTLTGITQPASGTNSIYTAIKAVTSSKVYYNATASNAVTIGADSFVGVTLGARFNGVEQLLNGSMYEFIIYRKKESDALVIRDAMNAFYSIY